MNHIFFPMNLQRNQKRDKNMLISARQKITNNEFDRTRVTTTGNNPDHVSDDDQSESVVGFSINDVRHHSRTRVDRKVNAFKQVTKRCYGHIQRRVDIKHRVCHFRVPEFIFGAPLYRLDECIDFLRQHLLMNGFNVTYVFPDLLVIRWSSAEEDAADEQRRAYYHHHNTSHRTPMLAIMPSHNPPSLPISSYTNNDQPTNNRSRPLNEWEQHTLAQIERLNPPRRSTPFTDMKHTQHPPSHHLINSDEALTEHRMRIERDTAMMMSSKPLNSGYIDPVTRYDDSSLVTTILGNSDPTLSVRRKNNGRLALRL